MHVAVGDSYDDLGRNSLSRGNKHWSCLFCCFVFALLLVLVVVSLSVSSGPNNKTDESLPSDPLSRAEYLMQKNLVWDGHNDLAYQYREQFDNQVWQNNKAPNLNENTPSLQTDWIRARQGKLSAQFWSIYVGCDRQGKDAVRATLEQVDVMYKLLERYSDTITLVTSADEVVDVFSQGKIASLMGVEGGHSIDSSLGTLRMLYRLGVRYLTLTHSCNTPWADSSIATNNPEHNGLTDFGEEVVREMNRLGMLVDLSHVSPKTMHHALDVTVSPVYFSHSSAYALCPNDRNVPDDVLLRLPQNGGVVAVNFYTAYINCNESQQATIQDVADHMDHIKRVAGVAHVALGGDYDGLCSYLTDGPEFCDRQLPVDMPDISGYPLLVAELIRRGWNDKEVVMLLSGNTMRVLRANEEVALKLKGAGLLPSERTLTIENSACRGDS
eukprot:gb/GEZN01008691.1/.p1 GENE.gb/GEZN01008691.1/~~gb/GEZN01008691.1/.p1  ORF type:complete len:441 (+),score=53.97 gb/GEZN01008691.1/:19-1341(+)